ncbi:MAG: ATP-binding protein [Candidatus Omnitrophica bacterium 4484_70.2]|nr:MAG: ATP-binding protein [Candidatus Omnitrophica bacterium 4484_70.2]
MKDKNFESILETIRNNLSSIKHRLLVISGKGGVGKTTVSVILATGLVRRNYKVGILDADVCGPNIAKMFGKKERLEAVDSKIKPLEVAPNLKIVSMALVLDNESQPVIWRGPLRTTLIRQFLADTLWGDLDFLIIDAPPGTGDEPLSVAQFIPDISGTIIVTTPQEVALLDVKKAISFAKELKIPIIGIIENMSSLICPWCGRKIDLFGKGGGEKLARDFNLVFLGRIPFVSSIVKFSDEGKFLNFKEDKTGIGEILEKILNFLENENIS